MNQRKSRKSQRKGLFSPITEAIPDFINFSDDLNPPARQSHKSVNQSNPQKSIGTRRKPPMTMQNIIRGVKMASMLRKTRRTATNTVD